MIPIKNLLYKIDLKLNKVASGKGQRVSNANKILALREAILRVFKKKISVNNIFQVGFDGMKPRYEELQNLVVSYEEVQTTKTNEVYTSYSIDLSTLSNRYFMLVDVVGVGERGDCKERIINVPRLIKHMELQSYINNSHYCPSFDYQETLATISNNKLILYANDPEGDFKINKVRVSYLRYPAIVDYEGIKNLDGTMSTTVDCDMSEVLEDEILEHAIMELGLNTGNVNAYQGSVEKSKNSEV